MNFTTSRSIIIRSLIAFAVMGISMNIVRSDDIVKKHPTSEALKAAMSDIRTAVINNHTLITHRRFPRPMAMGLPRT